MANLTLHTKLAALPPDQQSEVNDFIDFLINKAAKKTQVKMPQFGCAKGKIHFAADFDEPLEDFKEYM